jgi:ketosteroid isomerase-like protein
MKQPMVVAFAVTFAGLLAVGCAHHVDSSPGEDNRATTSLDLAAMRKIIDERNALFTRAHVEGDRATIDGMFTRDAKVLPPGAEPVIGRAAIDQLTRNYIEFGIADFREVTTDFYGNDDLLIDQGDYVLVYGKENTIEKGKYLNVWRKEDGAWKIHSNIWNTNSPDVSVE